MKITTKKVAEAGLLLAIILIMQTIKNVSAFISGPIINAVLVIAALELGIWWGIGFSIITPLTSILIAPMSPMTMITQATYGVNLPVIMIGNIIFVLLAYFGRKKGEKEFVAGLILGAILKWLFMWGAADLIIKPIFEQNLGKLVAAVNKVFSTLQLYSGLLGAIIIYPVSRAISAVRTKKDE